MSSLQNYIRALEDFELLALYKYRYDTFMKRSRNKIMTEIKNRNLNLEQIDDYINKAKGTDVELKNSDCCPRCYSRKSYQAKEKDWVHYRYLSYEITNNFKTCMICLYSQDKKVYKKGKRGGWLFRLFEKMAQS